MDAEPAAADGLPDTARGADMRRTYPAGRILHLVPARLAFPYFQPPDSGAPSSMSQHVSVPIPHLNSISIRAGEAHPAPDACTPRLFLLPAAPQRLRASRLSLSMWKAA